MKTTLLVIITFSLFIREFFSTIYHVSPSGNDGNSGTEGSPFQTISHSIDQLGPGDKLYMRQGTIFFECTEYSSKGPSVARKIIYDTTGPKLEEIMSYPGETATIDGTGMSTTTSWGCVTIIDQSYIHLRNFNIRNCEGFGIRVCCGESATRPNGIVVENIDTRYTGCSGIWVEGYDVKVTRCTIDDANEAYHQEGLSVANAELFEVTHNTVLNSYKETLDVKDGSKHGLVAYNVIKNTYPYGGGTTYCHPDIYLDGWDSYIENVTVRNNYCHSRHSGITLGTEQGGWMKDVFVYDNVFRMSALHGTAFSTVYVADWSGSDWKDNIVVRNNYFEIFPGNTGSPVYFQDNPDLYENFEFKNNIIVNQDQWGNVLNCDSAADGVLTSSHWDFSDNIVIHNGDFIGFGCVSGGYTDKNIQKDMSVFSNYNVNGMNVRLDNSCPMYDTF